MSVLPNRPADADPDPHSASMERISLRTNRSPTTQWDRRWLAGGAVGLAAVVGGCLIVAMVAAENRTKHVNPSDPTPAPPAQTDTASQAALPTYRSVVGGGVGTAPPCGSAAADLSCPPDAVPSAQANPVASGATRNTALTPSQQAAATAASSGVLVDGAQDNRPPSTAPSEPMREVGISMPTSVAANEPVSSPGEVNAQNGQVEKRTFANAAVNQDYIAGTEQHPSSPYELKAGSVIAAALLTGINSDLPGEVVAQVTEPVYDHRTGRTVLIPQGSRLVGQYDSQVAYGQARALVSWNRIILPNGNSVNIGAMGGADLTGASGLHDRVNQHFGDLVKGILLSTLISIGASSAESASTQSSGATVFNNAGAGIANASTEAGNRITDRQLNRQPTIEIRAGWPLRVIVSRDMTLEPYQQ